MWLTVICVQRFSFSKYSMILSANELIAHANKNFALCDTRGGDDTRGGRDKTIGGGGDDTNK